MKGKKGGLARHLQGWEAGLVAVVIAALGTLLAVPLRVPPEDVPLPLVDGRALTATLAHDRALSAAVVPRLLQEQANPGEVAELFDLRALGQELRAYGSAEASGDPYQLVRARRALVTAVTRARGLGDDRLLGLRSYQSELFLAELVRWENSGTVSEELVGLAGPFAQLAHRQRWLEGRTLVLDDVIRRIFWKRRWNEITGLTGAPFALSLDENRAFYAFLLTHPFLEAETAEDAREACTRIDLWRLRKVEELARFDPSYPYALSRGVLSIVWAGSPPLYNPFATTWSPTTEGAMRCGRATTSRPPTRALPKSASAGLAGSVRAGFVLPAG